MADPALRRALLHIGSVCKALIACRVSPAQKAEIVSLVRDGVYPKPCTLAIGDGANDVTMIQRADLGVGISGREGRQAVNSADFAIGQFRFLRRLLFVHGRRNYIRTSKVFLLSFYKNGMLMVAVFIYSFFTLMSGTSPFSSDLYLGYNWFTGAPVMLLGVFDNDISAEFLLGVPQLYETGRRSMELSFKVFGQWILRALVHGSICAIVPILVYTQQTNTKHHGTGLYAFGLVVFAAVFYCVLVICGIETRSWTWLHAFFYPGSAVFFIGVSILLSLSTGGMMDIGFSVVTSGLLNLVALVFIPLSVLALETLCKQLRKSIWPNLSDLAAEADWGKAGKTLQDPREFRARLEAKTGAVPRVPMLRSDSIDGMMENTYTQRQSTRTLGANVAKDAGHYVSLSERSL
jgi:magnesium-transporting ATPase (P-type)